MRGLGLGWAALLSATTSVAASGPPVAEEAGAIPPSRTTSRVGARTDNQPVDVLSADVTASRWISTKIELSAAAEGIVFSAPGERLWGSLGRGSIRARLGTDDVDLRADIAGRYWSDSASRALGGGSGELFPRGALRFAAGAMRSEELSTPASASLHVFRDTGFLGASLHDWHALGGAARVEATRFSDGNGAWVALGWLAYTLVNRDVRVDLGYAGAYRDSARSHWDSSTQRYYPYTTPLVALRHGPVVGAALSAGKLTAGATASFALVASERDPTTFEFYVSRRDTSFFELKTHLRLGSDENGIEVGYEYLKDGYYTWHTARLSTHVRL